MIFNHAPQWRPGKDGPAEPLLPRQGGIALSFQRFEYADLVRDGLRRTGAAHDAGNLTAVLGIVTEQGGSLHG
jgi:hypothetical protein